MDRPAPIHLKEMYRIIIYVLETKRYGLKFHPKDDHGSFKPSVTVILLETGKQEEVFIDTCIFLWNTNCMEKRRYEKCGTVNYRS